MEWNLLIFCLIGGLVSADSDTFLQSMFSQPLIACSIVGLLFDNFTLGLTIGMLMQLPYLAEVPVGARNLSFGNLGAYVATGIAIFLSEKTGGSENLILMLTILWGVVISYITSPFLRYRRNFNLILVQKADQAVQKGNLSKISLYHYLGVATAFVFGVLYCLVFFLLGEISINQILTRIPSAVETKLVFIKPVLFGAGLGAMMYCFVNRKSLGLMGIGLITGVIFLLLRSFF